MTAPHDSEYRKNDPQRTSYGGIMQGVPSIFSDFDLYLFGQGQHYHIYEKMGAHSRTVEDIKGGKFCGVGSQCAGSVHHW